MINNPDTSNAENTEVQYLKAEAGGKKKLQGIADRIYAASNLEEIIIDLEEEITSFFNAQRLTVYVVDGIKRELVSRFKSGNEIAEIRIPISYKSLAGFTALNHQLLNIKNCYDPKELAQIDSALQFDNTWDKKMNFITREVLVAPIIYKTFLLGTIQLINRKNAQSFTKSNEECVTELAEILGNALYNQKRMAAKGKTNKFDYLHENNILTQKELKKAIVDASQKKEPIETFLIKDLKIPKKDVLESLSKYYNVDYVEYNTNIPIPGELLVGLKISFMRNNVWVPLRIEKENIVIAVDNPNHLQKIDEIKSLFPGKKLRFCVALKQDILDLIKLFTQDEKEMAAIDDILSKLQQEAEEEEEGESAADEVDSAVVQLVNKIILDASARGASDIHIEPYPGKKSTQVRVRVDGNCYLYQTIPYNYRNAVVSRIKIMSDLDIAERRIPQDGKIKFKKYGGKDIELRVATVPTQGGLEDVVMRILAAGEPIPLDKMAFSKRNYDNFLSVITKPYGIIFVCGPTGSGKTTTLHSALGYINKTETKIWTAEDPVEITQQGLRQVQVKPKIGFDFATAMRAFLRADPDVIMVGEMRDKETTQIGIEASLTGHLVFSTLHTNSAPESITRLLDMGMDPFNFADAILCILAQRLVLTLCKDCKESYHPSESEFEELVREYGPEDFKRNEDISYTDDLTLFRPKGCDACNNTGYRGRMGLHELLLGTDEIKKLIQNKARMEEIRVQAIKDGMTTLKQDGIQKIFKGNCDLIQVRKVCIK
ncbi:MAG: Flp pilus assembly complex ATPase component TadA [Desulfobacterales bacterium]|nr:Flp pilus assembly complex ATPase component TadA [Desulfobacterales bacterium]